MRSQEGDLIYYSSSLDINSLLITLNSLRHVLSHPDYHIPILSANMFFILLFSFVISLFFLGEEKAVGIRTW